MKYKNFELDKFQEDAIHSIEKNNSVVVSAATGTGKTLIADYIIEKFIKEGKRVIYTAPIKALSNQKYRDFKESYGEDKIGILTGDVVINEKAPILIMTTEVYRNMLMDYSIVPDLTYVIFDEIHYMNDPDRGTVWEESIIFSPSSVRFLCLSATIPNADQFADWIKSIKEHDVDVVKYTKRPVPLKHFFYDNELGVIKPKNLKKHLHKPKKKEYFKTHQREEPDHLGLINTIIEKDLLNCIFFCFSRAKVRDLALDSAKNLDFTNSKQKARITEIYDELLKHNPQVKVMKSIQELRSVIIKGIGIHHAGLMPKAKEIVEILFEKGLLKILFTTETFALGLNFPARSVVIYSMRKFDGRTFRYLHTKEYFQIAGRAGRRGIDEKGNVYTMLDKSSIEAERVLKIIQADSEPITSQFALGVNVVLNMLDHYGNDQIEEILKSNFGYYLKKKNNSRQIRIKATFNNIVRKLTKHNYITKDNVLTSKGKFAAKIYADELLITELLFSNAFHELNEIDVNILIGAIVYEPRRQDRLHKTKPEKLKIDWTNTIIHKRLKERKIEKIAIIVKKWSKGCEFKELLSLCNLQEGDLIRFFRQIIDRLIQIRRAEPLIADKITESIKLIDRDIISVQI